MSNFQSRFTPKERLAESTRIKTKYPYRYPVIVEIVDNSTLPLLDKTKYLCSDINMGQLTYVIRNRLSLMQEEAIFIHVQQRLIPSSKPMSEVYEQYKDVDGFLYVTVSAENVFGYGRSIFDWLMIK